MQHVPHVLCFLSFIYIYLCFVKNIFLHYRHLITTIWFSVIKEITKKFSYAIYYSVDDLIYFSNVRIFLHKCRNSCMYNNPTTSYPNFMIFMLRILSFIYFRNTFYSKGEHRLHVCVQQNSYLVVLLCI